MNLDYLILALKNLRHRGIRSWLTLLGIFIGVTAVVALIGLGNGLQAAVSAQFGISSTEIITVQAGGLNAYGPPGSGVVNSLTKDDARAIENIGSVNRVLPRYIQTGKLEFNDRVIFGFASNVPRGDDADFMYEVNDLEIDKGRMLGGSDSNKVVLGANFFVDKVGLEKEVVLGDNVLVQDKSFRVVGILKKKGSFVWDSIVLMDQVALEDLFDTGDDVDVIVAHIKDPDLMDRAAEDIAKLLRKRRDVDEGEEDFEVSTPEATMETVNSILGGVQAFIIIIASISILVGALGIVNTMTTSVLERKKEIGIMKAIGGTNWQIFMQFFFESGLLGLIGGLVGAVLGTLISVAGVAGINSFLGSDMTPVVDFMLIGMALFGSFMIGAIAGIVPAMSAAKQNPVEALRG